MGMSLEYNVIDVNSPFRTQYVEAEHLESNTKLEKPAVYHKAWLDVSCARYEMSWQ